MSNQRWVDYDEYDSRVKKFKDVCSYISHKRLNGPAICGETQFIVRHRTVGYQLRCIPCSGKISMYNLADMERIASQERPYKLGKAFTVQMETELYNDLKLKDKDLLSPTLGINPSNDGLPKELISIINSYVGERIYFSFCKIQYETHISISVYVKGPDGVMYPVRWIDCPDKLLASYAKWMSGKVSIVPEHFDRRPEVTCNAAHHEIDVTLSSPFLR